MSPLVMCVKAEPRRRSSKRFANSNGLAVQLGELEKFHTLGKRGRALETYVMVLIQDFLTHRE